MEPATRSSRRASKFGNERERSHERNRQIEQPRRPDGRWSARHRKIAIFGWLAFVAVAFVLGGLVGTKKLTDADTQAGESGRAARIYAQGGLDRGDPERPRPERDAHEGRPLRPGPSFGGGAAEIERILAAVQTAARGHPGFYVGEFGDASATKAFDDTQGNDSRRAEYLSIPLTLAILLVAFGALVATGIPLLLALTSVFGALGLLALPSHDLARGRRGELRHPADRAHGPGRLLALLHPARARGTCTRQ